MTPDPAQTKSKEYIRPMPATWWLRRKTYFLFMVRELTSVFVGGYAVFLLVLVWRAQDAQSFSAFVEGLKGSLSIVLHLAAIRSRLRVSVPRLLPARVLILLSVGAGVSGAVGLAIHSTLDPLPGLILCCVAVPSVFFAIAFMTRTMTALDFAFVMPQRWASRASR